MVKTRVFFMHNVVSPYRLPVFEEVAKKANIDVYFCKTKTNDRKWSTSLKGYKFNHKILPSIQLGPFFVNPTLAWHLLKSKYDIYLVGDFPETALSIFLALIIAKIRRRPVVLWSETINNDVIYFQHLALSSKPHHRIILKALNFGIGIYRRLLINSADTYIALSQAARNFLITQGVSANLISSGIQVLPKSQLASPTRTKAESPYAQTKLFLYLGYFNTLKGINHLISAMSQVANPEVRLLIVGTGPEQDSLKQLASADKRIHFLGYTEGTAKANVMTWADVFVLPTLADCWGLVVNESLHYGTPVIISSTAGAAELITNGLNGITLAPGDPSALADEMNSLLNEPGRLSKLTKGARAYSADITESKVGAEPIIRALMAAGGKS